MTTPPPHLAAGTSGWPIRKVPSQEPSKSLCKEKMDTEVLPPSPPPLGGILPSVLLVHSLSWKLHEAVWCWLSPDFHIPLQQGFFVLPNWCPQATPLSYLLWCHTLLHVVTYQQVTLAYPISTPSLPLLFLPLEGAFC
eukprot:Sspe_Gene.40688::Locus_19665_Transcript_1_1_Confidence_1.000_Length_655::g.40688::m.40688